MRIQSSNPALLRVGHLVGDVGAEFIDVSVPNGSTDVNFYVHGMEGVTGAATITASAPGFTTSPTGTVNVLAPWLELVSVPDTTTTLSADSPFYVRTGVVLTGGTSFWAFQAPRPGGSGVSVNVTHTNTAVAQLVTTAGAAQTRTVNIAAGQFNSPTSVAAGGVAFDPIAAGTTIVSASATGYTAIRTETVTVTSPGMTLFGFPTNVGSGLHYGAFTARLGANLHGGVTMRIQSSNPALLRVGHACRRRGRGIHRRVRAERLDRRELLCARHGRGDGRSHDYGIGARIHHQPDRHGQRPRAMAGVGQCARHHDDALCGQPVLCADGSRADGRDVVLGVPGTAAWRFGRERQCDAHETAVAQLVTTAGAAQTRTVNIAAGQFNSPTSVAAGGVAFDPIAGGTTIVSASATGYTAIRTETVTVTSPGMTLFGFPTNVGSGLHYGAFTARLGADLHGGVTMRIQSSNPALLRVGHLVGDVGAEFIECPCRTARPT